MQTQILILSGKVERFKLQSGLQKESVARFYLVQTDGKGNQQSFVCKVCGQLAQQLAEWAAKGALNVTLFGRLTTTKYKGTDGKPENFTEVTVTEIYPYGANINKVLIAGRFTQEPQYYPAKEGKKSFLHNAVAVTTNKGADSEHTEFIDCTLFGKVADFVGKYFAKGSAIWLEGRLLLDSYTAKDNKPKVAHKVNVIRADFLEGRKSVAAPAVPDAAMQQAQASKPTADGYAPKPQTAEDADGFMPVPDTDDDMSLQPGWGDFAV